MLKKHMTKRRGGGSTYTPPVVSGTDGRFTFTMPVGSSRCSAIVRRVSDGVTVRTLWNNKPYATGSQQGFWNGKDDFNNVVSGVETYQVIVRYNDINYLWQGGRIGNTSTAQTGISRFRFFETTRGMAIHSGRAYCAAGYNEASAAGYAFDLSDIGTRVEILPKESGQSTSFICTDGTIVYFGGGDPYAKNRFWVYGMNIADSTLTAFSSGVAYDMVKGRLYSNAIDLTDNLSAAITGMAVQRTGNFLFVAHGGTNELHVLNKTTGALVQNITIFTNPRALAVDSDNNLWVVSATNTIAKYSVNASTGALTSVSVSITGTTAPLAIDVYSNTLVGICDGGSSQQVKFYNNTTGASTATLGDAGGYLTNEVVSNSKFDFTGYELSVFTFIAFNQGDGSFWIGDSGNFRMQHYNASRVFVDRVMYLPGIYSSRVNRSDNTRIYANYLEFSRNYSFTLDNGANGSWALTKNWRQGITADYNNQYQQLRDVTTFPNGRTYALNGIKNAGSSVLELVELVEGAGLRLTGVRFTNSTTSLHPGGTLRYIEISNQSSTPQIYYGRTLSGYDGSNNPLWNTASEIARTPTGNLTDPLHRGNPQKFRSGEITSGNIVVAYDAKAQATQPYGMHLGGIVLGETTYKWKAMMSTHAEYKGEQPVDAFEIGNGVTTDGAGIAAQAIENSIFCGCHNEFWKNTQSNNYYHFYEDGLLLGFFGSNGKEGPNEADPGEAGNTYLSHVSKVGSDYYMHHNDEMHFAALHEWKITNLSSITAQTISIAYPSTPSPIVIPGLDLMSNLPFNAVLPVANGWSRSAESFSDSNNYCTALTSRKDYDKINPSSIYFAAKGLSITKTVDRSLGSNSGLSSWTLQGELSFEGNNGNQSGFGAFLQVLDNTGKVIAQVMQDFLGSPNRYGIYGNSGTIVLDTTDAMYYAVKFLRPLTILCNASGCTFTFYNYNPITVAIHDGTANRQAPATMRLLITNSGSQNSTRAISINKMRFFTT